MQQSSYIPLTILVLLRVDQNSIKERTHPMNVETQLAELGVRLAEIGIKNSFSAISTKIQAVKSKNVDNETIQQLEEIINGLIDDRNELIRIAKAYQQELVAQQISQENIEYITTKFIPRLKEFIKQTSNSKSGSEVAEIEKTIDGLTPLLSVEMLTVLQLVGFNFKKAIGEPLTLLLQKSIASIASKIPTDPQSNLEYNKLVVALNTEIIKVAQDKDTSDRLERLRSKGIL